MIPPHRGGPRHALAAALAAALAGVSCGSERSGAGTRATTAPTASPALVPSSAPAPSGFDVGGAIVELVIEGDDLTVPREVVEAWVRRAAQDVSGYYGGAFPVPSLRVTVESRSRGSIGFGQHWDGRFVRVHVGADATAADFERDWVLVHEMLHAGFPDLDRRHKWMQEGLSTYLQWIVQARSRRFVPDRVWASFLRMMHHGRPRAGDRGLDQTRTWGRLYWGGALFWLVADVRIREATDNRRSLRDALRGIVAAGGNGRAHWSTARVVAAGDEATGTAVLRELYVEMAEAPGDVDLERLWRRLGVREGAGEDEVVFDEDAELAAVRRAITAAEG